MGFILFSLCAVYLQNGIFKPFCVGLEDTCPVYMSHGLFTFSAIACLSPASKSKLLLTDDDFRTRGTVSSFLLASEERLGVRRQASSYGAGGWARS